ncbi:MAG: monovalent cation/H+ antiporter subunit D [Candidatus Saccharicenans subterraneus]|uniref:Monovalent cation/H+ antiporter subunit D n=1 Tax=Candidatus Saccharicenans subterraneus TaxID=2508984 RepID=A0A3E2BQD0_9BACT|nr:MAG: monovalent cation/H+ antiporter subunit D [Candidatus Saccharicenans subterraneum]
MSPTTLLWPILFPAAVAVVLLLIPSRVKYLREVLSVLSSGALLYLGFVLFSQRNLSLVADWLGLGINFDLRLYHFSAFILLALSGFLFLISLYSAVKMRNHPRVREYYGYVFLAAAFSNGAVLANNFVLLVFFWEALLITTYALVTLGLKPTSHRTAVKSLIIGGFCDFAMILGIGLLWASTGTLTMDKIQVEPHGLTVAAFVLMMIGAIGKAGAMPFHTWIPDAALDAPVSFMAFMPASFEKLLGIYLLARITLDFFELKVGSGLSILLMIIGAATIVLAVFMALIQKDFKKLLSFHAVSQVGYMVLGVGTAIPIGIAGGIFHMINHAMYKCGLFLSSGSVEHRTGTTELKKLGGLAREMPWTAAGFVVCALAISGVWPLNGFVSKEMVFHGALETGYPIFAIAAWLGAIFTFASFLKAGHSVFFGPRSTEVPKTRESEAPIVLPILILAALCITFGVYNKLPLQNFIQPILSGHVEAGEHLDFTSHALDLFNPVAGVSILCLIIALGIHFYGWNRGGKKAYLASEPIHNLPVLHKLYDLSEARFFDLYEQGVKFLQWLSRLLFRFIDRPIDYLYEKVVTATGRTFTGLLQKAHNGQYANYLAWTVGGLVVVVWIILQLLK